MPRVSEYWSYVRECSENLRRVGLLADAVVELLLDQSPQRIPIDLGVGSHLRHLVVELG